MADEAAPNAEEAPQNWKLLLRYGRLETPYAHFTVLVDVDVIEPDEDVGSQLGPAWMSMKVWAPSAEDAGEIICDIAPQLGAQVRGKWEVYRSDPDEPPQEMPYAYDVTFTPYKE